MKEIVFWRLDKVLAETSLKIAAYPVDLRFVYM